MSLAETDWLFPYSHVFEEPQITIFCHYSFYSKNYIDTKDIFSVSTIFRVANSINSWLILSLRADLV